MTSPHDPPSEVRPSPEHPESSTRQVEFPVFRRLTFWSVLGGLCPLIPLPFIDDWTLSAVKRRMVRELAGRQGVALGPGEVRILTGGGDFRIPGCLGILAWVLGKVVLRILKKLFRTLFYFFAIRDGIVRATETFHEGYLVLQAARQGVLGSAPESARPVRRAMVATLAEIDLRPIRLAIARAFRGSLALLLKASRILGQAFGRRRRGAAGEPASSEETAALEREEELLGSFVDRLARSLWGNRDHFERLEAVFRRQLEQPPPPAAMR